MLKISLKTKSSANIQNLDEGRKDDANNFINKISGGDTAKKQKYQQALDIMLKNPIADNKYLLWMLKHLEETENVEAMISAVTQYNLLQKNIESGNPLKDINNIKSFQHLTDVIEDYAKSIKELEKEGQKIVVSKDETGGHFEVIRPLNVYASCELGKNSRWCIAATKSKNYYRSYSTKGIVFYTIIDHTKPIKHKNSMFTYALSQAKDANDIEIYNAEDDGLSREEVQKIIGKETEESFFQKMEEESGLGIKSTTEESYNTFFSRIMRWVKTLKRYDRPLAKLPIKDEEKYNEVEQEITDFYEGWLDKRKEGNSKAAIRNVVEFTKKISEIDNVLLKYRVGSLIRFDFGNIPELMNLLPDLIRDPNWLKDADKKFQYLNNMDPLHSSVFDTNEDGDNRQPEEKLFEFVEQAIYNNKTGYIKKLLDKYLKAAREIGSDKKFDKSTLDARVDAIIKPCVFNGYSGAGEMLKSMLDFSDSPMKKLQKIFFTGYGIAEHPERLAKYGNDIIQYSIDRFGSDKKKIDDLANVIVSIKGLDKKYYEYALDNSKDFSIRISFPVYNDINVLDPKYQEKIADEINTYVRISGNRPQAGSLLPNAIFGILSSNSISKKVASQLLTRLFAKGWYQFLPNTFIDELFDKYGNDPDIDSPVFKEDYNARRGLEESKLFIYSNDYRVYRTLIC